MTENNQLKKRHGFVSFWLIFIIATNSITILMNIFKPNLVSKGLNNPSQLIMILYSLVAMLNIVFALLILKWKKLAFWGFIITGIFGASLNLYVGSSIFTSLIGLVGIPILYGILQLKKDNVPAWNYLE